MNDLKEKSPDNTELITKNNYILKKWQQNVNYTYELINIIEQAKITTKDRLLCIIAKVKEELGKAVLVAKLDSIFEERFLK